MNYPPDVWAGLFSACVASQSSQASLSPTDRATLLDDYLTFAESTALASQGISTVEGFAAIAQLLEKETSYEVLSVALLHLGIFQALLVPDIATSAANPENPSSQDPLPPGSSELSCYTNFTSWAAAQLAPLRRRRATAFGRFRGRPAAARRRL